MASIWRSLEIQEEEIIRQGNKKRNENMICTQVYKDIYHKDPAFTSFCPYRISPLGAHIDHQLGRINGLAIDKGIHIAYSPKHNGVIELQSINFPGKRAQFHGVYLKIVGKTTI